MVCKIFSPYDQFISRSLKFTKRQLTYAVGMNEYMDQVTTDFLYKRYLFDFDAAYRDRNLFFVFDLNKMNLSVQTKIQTTDL